MSHKRHRVRWFSDSFLPGLVTGVGMAVAFYAVQLAFGLGSESPLVTFAITLGGIIFLVFLMSLFYPVDSFKVTHPPSGLTGTCEEVTRYLREALHNIRMSGIDLNAQYAVNLDHDGRPVVVGVLTSSAGEMVLSLKGDDLRSEPAVRFQLLNLWSEMLRRQSEAFLSRPRESA